MNGKFQLDVSFINFTRFDTRLEISKINHATTTGYPMNLLTISQHHAPSKTKGKGKQ